MLEAKLAARLPSAFLRPRPPTAAVNHLRHSTSFHRRLTFRPIPRTIVLRAKLDGSSHGKKPDPVEMESGAFSDYDHGDEDVEEEKESSINLLIRFLQSSLKKVTKQAEMAFRSVLSAVEWVLIMTGLFVLISFATVCSALKSTISAAIQIVQIVAAIPIVEQILQVVWGSFDGLLIMAVIVIHWSRLKVFYTRASIFLAALLIVVIGLESVINFPSSGDDGRRSSSTRQPVG